MCCYDKILVNVATYAKQSIPVLPHLMNGITNVMWASESSCWFLKLMKLFVPLIFRPYSGKSFNPMGHNCTNIRLLLLVLVVVVVVVVVMVLSEYIAIFLCRTFYLPCPCPCEFHCSHITSNPQPIKIFCNRRFKKNISYPIYRYIHSLSTYQISHS